MREFGSGRHLRPGMDRWKRPLNIGESVSEMEFDVFPAIERLLSVFNASASETHTDDNAATQALSADFC